VIACPLCSRSGGTARTLFDTGVAHLLSEKTLQYAKFAVAVLGKRLLRRETVLRAVAILIALAVGWVVYMIAMMMTVYDGLLSLILQPIMAVFWSVLTVGCALLLGLIFKIPVLGRLWRKSSLPAILLISASLFTLCFGYSLGLRQSYTDPETQQQIVLLRADAALGSYFVLLFTIANWPLKVRQGTHFTDEWARVG